MTPKTDTCIIHDCGRPAVSRGLCRPCYYAARRLIELGETCWLELEKAGLALPLHGKTRGPFGEAFAAMKKEKSDGTD